MKDLSLVMLGAGSSSRFDSSVKKQWLRIGHEPLWLHATNNIASTYNFKEIIVVAPKSDINYMEHFGDFIFCEGGESRQESLKNALELVTSSHVMVSDIARATIPHDLIHRLINSSECADIIVPALKVCDTVFFQDDPIDRDDVRLIQTPQLSRTHILKEALKNPISFTDDSSLIKAQGGTAWYVEGDELAHKITYQKDLKRFTHLKAPDSASFTGIGYDVHAFSDKGVMKLCGVEVSKEFGFIAHSDGDVALHALTDAILGAICAGAIGEFFSDSDERYKGADSTELLLHVVNFVKSVGFEFVHCDITIIAQTPKISHFKKQMRQRVAQILGVEPYLVNVKATTTERLGFVGRKEGVAVEACATLKYFDWTEK